MELKIKAVVFEHPEPQTWGNYCGYCPATLYFCSGANTDEVSERIKRAIKIECNVHLPERYIKLGWKLLENSIIPPNFADEELIKLTEESYCIKIDNPIIVELNVKISSIEDLL